MDEQDLTSVDLDAKIVLNLVSNHAFSGVLLGINESNVLKITNSFLVPNAKEAQNSSNFEVLMLDNLAKMNYEVNVVGWFASYSVEINIHQMVLAQLERQLKNPQGTRV